MNSGKSDQDWKRKGHPLKIESHARENRLIISHNLKIIQHNILNWKTNKQLLIPDYLLNNHDLIPISKKKTENS